MTSWWQTPVKPLDKSARAQASQRQDTLTKPPGSLGRLEEIAILLAAMRASEKPRIEQPSITVFAGDHGVVAEGVAAFPQAVTQQMLANFVAGGAAISVLASAQGARLEVVDVGTLAAESIAGVVNGKVGFGTANLAREPAMTEAQCMHSLDQGRLAVQRALTAGADIFIGGEMGIGNTTPAAALSCALLGLPGAALAGPGTGLDAAGVSHKATVIDRALALHGFLPSPAGGGGAGAARDLADVVGQPSRLAGSPIREGQFPAQTKPLPREILSHARELRKNQTDAEQLLWEVLRAKRFMDLKFRRQHAVAPYILDFYCDALKLVIELDGGQHAERQGYDQARTAFLEGKGMTVRRFWNNQVLAETEAVLDAIYAAVVQLQPLPSLIGLPANRLGCPTTSAKSLAAPAPPPLAGEGSIAALRCLGGFEIAALAGAYIACAQAGLPALVDGFITSAAALAACRLNPGTRDWLLFAHASAEPGHARVLAALDARPLLQLDMRLGEGSGAATALPLLRLACALHAGMATFAEAGVSRGD